MDVMSPDNLNAIDKWNVSALCSSLLVQKCPVSIDAAKNQEYLLGMTRKRRSYLKQRLPDKRNPRNNQRRVRLCFNNFTYHNYLTNLLCRNCHYIFFQLYNISL